MSGRKGPPPDERRCRFIVAARYVLGTAWSPEHRFLHVAKVNGYCRQHQPREQTDELIVLDEATNVAILHACHPTPRHPSASVEP